MSKHGMDMATAIVLQYGSTQLATLHTAVTVPTPCIATISGTKGLCVVPSLADYLRSSSFDADPFLLPLSAGMACRQDLHSRAHLAQQRKDHRGNRWCASTLPSQL